MNPLQEALQALECYERVEDLTRAERLLRRAEVCALIAIAQELRIMNEHAELEAERAETHVA